MYKDPRKTLQCIHNRVTVALPLETVDVDLIAEKIKIEDLADVDIETEGKTDGVLLVFNQNTQQWQSTKLLDRQQMDAGEYWNITFNERIISDYGWNSY